MFLVVFEEAFISEASVFISAVSIFVTFIAVTVTVFLVLFEFSTVFVSVFTKACGSFFSFFLNFYLTNYCKIDNSVLKRIFVTTFVFRLAIIEPCMPFSRFAFLKVPIVIEMLSFSDSFAVALFIFIKFAFVSVIFFICH